MVKNMQAVLIALICFIIVAFMYIGGLRSDARREGKLKHEKKLVAEKTDVEVVKTNGIPEDVTASPLSSSIEEQANTGQTQETKPISNTPSPTQLPIKQNLEDKQETNVIQNGESKTEPSVSVNQAVPSTTKNTNKTENNEQISTKEKNATGRLKSSTSVSSSTVDVKKKLIDNLAPSNEEEVLEVDKESTEENDKQETLEVVDEQIPSDELDSVQEESPNDIEEIKEETETDDNKELDQEEPEEVDKDTDEPEEPILTALEQAEKLAAIGDLDSFLKLTQMVEDSDDTLEQRKLIKIAGTMSDTLEPEVLFEILKVSTSEEMLKMAVVTLSEANTSTVVQMAADNYAATTDPVEQDYLLDVIVKSSDPAVIDSLSNIASANSYSTPIGQAAINTLAIIGSTESTENLINRLDNTNSESDIELLTKSISKIHSADALPTLKENLSVNLDDVAKSIAIVKALGNYSAKDVSQTLDSLYSQPNLNSSLKYEIDKTYEKITK
jgi:hypothetical protein